MKKTAFILFATVSCAVVYSQEKEQPPPPPPPPKVVKVIPPPPPPQPAKPKLPSDQEAFLKRNQEVKSISWFNEGKSVRIKLKSGEKEEYNLEVKEEKEKVVKKYGQLPKAPPPPPKVNIEKFIPPPPPPIKEG